MFSIQIAWVYNILYSYKINCMGCNLIYEMWYVYYCMYYWSMLYIIYFYSTVTCNNVYCSLSPTRDILKE